MKKTIATVMMLLAMLAAMLLCVGCGGQAAPPEAAAHTETLAIPLQARVPALEGLDLGAETLTLTTGESHSLKAAPLPASAGTTGLTYVSSSATVARVDATGRVTALSAGECTITAICGAVRSHIAVTVQPPALAVQLAGAEGTLNAGESLKLNATLLPEDAEAELVWASSDETVATVDDAGTVTAHTPGSAVISAGVKGHEDARAEYRLTVAAPPAGQGKAGTTGSGAGSAGGGTAATGGTPAAGGGGQPAYTPGGAGDPGYFYCELCITYHKKGVLASCGRGHSTIGTDCTWVLRDAYSATCYENRLEIYDCAENCGMCHLKTIENSTIPCEYTRLVDAVEDGEIVQKYICHMCGAFAP